MHERVAGLIGPSTGPVLVHLGCVRALGPADRAASRSRAQFVMPYLADSAIRRVDLAMLRGFAG